MPRAEPPRACPSLRGPLIRSSRIDRPWWRIHRAGRDARSFRDTGAEDKRADPRTHGTEGRFDCQAGEYGYLYLGAARHTAIAEAFLRGPVIADPTARVVRASKASGMAVTRLRRSVALPLVDLRSAEGLGRVGQDAWLTTTDEADYPLTQRWATSIRAWAPGAAGMIWMSRRDPAEEAAILFADRTPDVALVVEHVRALDDPVGFALLQATLSRFTVDLDGGARPGMERARRSRTLRT